MSRRPNWWVASSDGNEPDYRFTLANERTFLAWMRTALGLLAGGIAVREFVTGLDVAWARTAIAVAAIAASVVTTIGAYLRWVRVQQAVRRGEPLPLTPLTAFLAAALVLIAVFAVIAVVGS